MKGSGSADAARPPVPPKGRHLRPAPRVGIRPPAAPCRPSAGRVAPCCPSASGAPAPGGPPRWTAQTAPGPQSGQSGSRGLRHPRPPAAPPSAARQLRGAPPPCFAGLRPSPACSPWRRFRGHGGPAGCRGTDPRPLSEHGVPVDVAERPVVVALQPQCADVARGIDLMVARVVRRRVQHADVERPGLPVLVSGGQVLRHGPVREGVAVQGGPQARPTRTSRRPGTKTPARCPAGAAPG